ncbi:hypothetical protein [Aequorivita lipolytica]|uniref:DUF3558 domain-containing protein n=1 Tax=Aequorivita lipolytica TaxID=153267 RepID=A0A5C6YQV1_9FLAO|nr:hypothetical protein [Aequorivita lipolytica]TXD69922.1 hypothetical protein ESV24_05665 [Aequorivita lipolytica]SRX50256.1 hypothetical protein AEQU2_00727 [Aequorivita lipolytica]
MKKSLLLIAICIFTVACGNSETSKAENSQSDATVSEKDDSTAENENATSPCGLVTETKIKEVLGIPADDLTEIKDVMRTYPSCFYKWETIAFTTKKSIAGQEVILNYPAEASIVLVKNATEKMFGISTKVYKDGVAIDGIGDLAIWGSTMSQLTFLTKGTMIHLHVRISDDATANKVKAVELAALIIEQL